MVVPIELTATGCVIVVSFWGWLAVKVIDQGRKLVELGERISSQEKVCGERLDWLRLMEHKLITVGEDTAAICGKLEIDREPRD